MAWNNFPYYRKYRNKTVVVDGEKFDSVKELHRYQELKLLEKSGDISDLRRQVKYTLIPAQREENVIGKRGGVKKGKVLERECSYLADFSYLNRDGLRVVEDTKGMRTKDYIIKRKLMLYVHGIRIQEL